MLNSLIFFLVVTNILGQTEFLNKLDELVPFEDRDSFEELVTSDFVGITEVYPGKRFEHDLKSFKKFLYMFNSRYWKMHTTGSWEGKYSNDTPKSEIISSTEKSASFKISKFFKFAFDEKIKHNYKMDIWNFEFNVTFDTIWKIQNLSIYPNSKIDMSRAITSVMKRTENEVSRIVNKEPPRRIFFDPDWAEYLTNIKIARYYRDHKPKLNTYFELNKYNFKLENPANVTSFTDKRFDETLQFEVLIQTVEFHINVKFYCNYIEKYDEIYIESILSMHPFSYK